jgi:hypothetical protein
LKLCLLPVLFLQNIHSKTLLPSSCLALLPAVGFPFIPAALVLVSDHDESEAEATEVPMLQRVVLA